MVRPSERDPTPPTDQPERGPPPLTPPEEPETTPPAMDPAQPPPPDNPPPTNPFDRPVELKRHAAPSASGTSHLTGEVHELPHY